MPHRYGAAHKREREKVKREVEAGNAYCSRCGRFIQPGSDWHLDHSEDGKDYLGPAHARCNSLAGARKGGRITGGWGKVNAKRHSRRWY